MSHRQAWRHRLAFGALLALHAIAGTALAEQAEADPPTARKPLRFVVYGGTEGNGPRHRAVVKQIVALKPELVLHAGGLVRDVQEPEDWKAVDEIIAPLLDVTLFYACRGRGEVSLLHKDRLPPKNAVWGGTTFYSFDYRGVHFVALDSSLNLSVKDAQTRWLAEDLADADGRPSFVFFHRPIYTVAGKANHEDGRIFWEPLFARHKVRAVFSGGHHIYYRTVGKGVTYIVTGGGGAPLGEVISRYSLLPSDVAGEFHHCIEVTVAGERIRARVVDYEGKTRDEFLVPPSTPKPTP